jgi:hypothetical protein
MKLTIINEVGDDARTHAEQKPPAVEREPTTMLDFLDAVAATIAFSPAAQRRALARTIAAWNDDDYWWATGAQSPALLRDLVTEIDLATRPREGEKEALWAADRAADAA